MTQTPTTSAADHPRSPSFLTQGDPDRVITVGELHIEVASVRVSLAGTRVRLPLKEFELLLALADHAGHVMTYAQLVQMVWGKNYQDTNGTLKVHIMRLRRTIKAALGCDYIRNVRSLGYVLEAG